MQNQVFQDVDTIVVIFFWVWLKGAIGDIVNSTAMYIKEKQNGKIVEYSWNYEVHIDT